jgi:hypothetical protein
MRQEMSEAKRREEKQKSTYDQILAIINQQLKNANMSQPSYNVSTLLQQHHFHFVRQLLFMECLFIISGANRQSGTCAGLAQILIGQCSTA